MAAPGFISKGTKDEGNGSSVAPTYPGGIQAGDHIFIMAENVQSPTVVGIDTVAGYTSISEETFTWGTAKLMYKIATGSESGTETVSRSGSSGTPADFLMAQIYVIRGNGSRLTLESSAFNSDTGNTTVTWDAVTVNGSQRSLFAFVVDYDGSGISAPSGYSEEASDSSVAISGSTIKLFSKEDVSSDGSVTSTGSINGWATWHISEYNFSSRSFIVN